MCIKPSPVAMDQFSNASIIGLSQICLNICPKCFWKFPKICTYYALHVSHYTCIMLQY